MSRNFYNMLSVGLILLLVTACVCRSGRDAAMPDANGSDAPIDVSAQKPRQVDSNGGASSRDDRGDFTVEHVAFTNPRYEEIDRQLKTDKTLEKAADQLNRSLKLPRDIVLRTKDCGEVNAFYDSNDSSVTVCYELMEHFYKLFRSAGDSDEKAYESMFDAVKFVFLHEIGHALIDVYKLPITGNEEDAADRLSSFINLTRLGDEGVRSVLAASDAFVIESKNVIAGEQNLADEHLLQEQRSYNSLCMIYGSDPAKYAFIVEKKYLPKERAVRCAGEYERVTGSWSELLAPWRAAE